MLWSAVLNGAVYWWVSVCTNVVQVSCQWCSAAAAAASHHMTWHSMYTEWCFCNYARHTQTLTDRQTAVIHQCLLHSVMHGLTNQPTGWLDMTQASLSICPFPDRRGLKQAVRWPGPGPTTFMTDCRHGYESCLSKHRTLKVHFAAFKQ